MTTDNIDNNGKNKEYEVGYSKPPRSTRFGEPGGNKRNTKGRPQKPKILEFSRMSEEAFWQCFLDVANSPQGVKEDGEWRTVPFMLALAIDMSSRSLRGDKHARRDFLKYLEKSTKGKDSLVNEIQSSMANLRKSLLLLSGEEGTLKHLLTLREYFLSKEVLRGMSHGDDFVYEDGEPTTKKDWKVFNSYINQLKKGELNKIEWPPKYPSEIEAEEWCRQKEKEIDPQMDLFGDR